MTKKAEKLPLETEPVADDNNMVLSAKPGYQTSTVPYSTDNCSTLLSCCLQRVYAKPAIYAICLHIKYYFSYLFQVLSIILHQYIAYNFSGQNRFWKSTKPTMWFSKHWLEFAWQIRSISRNMLNGLSSKMWPFFHFLNWLYNNNCCWLQVIETCYTSAHKIVKILSIILGIEACIFLNWQLNNMLLFISSCVVICMTFITENIVWYTKYLTVLPKTFL